MLEGNPFPNQPPQFVRATLYEYHFTKAEERRRTGAWWTRKLRTQYFPAVSLRDFSR
ncbi:MAG: lipase maturation factor family protein [Chthoniobacterales bacterium]